MRKSTPGEHIANFALALLSIALGLLVVELAFRWRLGHEIVLFPRNHAEARYGTYTLRTMTPNLVFWHQSIDGRWRFTTNNKGFRDSKDYAYEKPASTFRVLVLGDSNTAGFEVDQDQTYASVLEQRLRQSGVRAEVLNTGVSGFGTAEQLAYLENEGIKYSPDAIVLAFFANDYSDNVRANLYALSDNNLVSVSHHYAPAIRIIRLTQAIPGLKWLGENSYAYSYTFNALWDFFKARSIRQAASAVPAQNAPLERPDLEHVGPSGEVTAAQEALAIALVKRVAQIARERGAMAILVDTPVPEGQYDAKSSLTPGVRAAGLAHFDRVLTSEEILDRRPANQAAHVPHGHRHINAYTHRRTAEALLQVMTSPAAGGTR